MIQSRQRKENDYYEHKPRVRQSSNNTNGVDGSGIRQFIAGEAIEKEQVLALLADGKVHVALPETIYANRIIGIAVESVNIDDLVKVQVEKEFFFEDQDFDLSKLVFLRASGISQIPLLVPDVSEDLYVELGKPLSTASILIDIRSFVFL